MYTSKSLISAQILIDPLKAQRFAFERYTMPTQGSCTDPMSLQYDQYGRRASPESLTTNTQGGACNFSSPIVNLQNFLIRENNVDRPYIYTDMTGSNGGYDALGFGRNMINSYTGGLENNIGGWERLNMGKNAKSNVQACLPPSTYRTDPLIPKSMSAANSIVYHG